MATKEIFFARYHDIYFVNMTTILLHGQLGKYFRLENGPEDACVGFSTVLVRLHQLVQLELIAFPIHRTLKNVILQLPKLNLLNLAPASSSNEQLAGTLLAFLCCS